VFVIYSLRVTFGCHLHILLRRVRWVQRRNGWDGQIGGSSVIVTYQCVSALQVNKMGGVIENYSKSEARVVVRYLQAEGGIQSEIHHRLMTVYNQQVFRQKELSVEADQGPLTLMKIVPSSKV
jgi:hypothetical protein